VTGLVIGDVAITGAAAKGNTISGSGTVWTVPITVSSQGNANVKITKAGIVSTEKAVAVYKSSAPGLAVVEVELNGQDYDANDGYGFAGWMDMTPSSFVIDKDSIISLADFKSKYKWLIIQADDYIDGPPDGDKESTWDSTLFYVWFAGNIEGADAYTGLADADILTANTFNKGSGKVYMVINLSDLPNNATVLTSTEWISFGLVLTGDAYEWYDGDWAPGDYIDDPGIIGNYRFFLTDVDMSTAANKPSDAQIFWGQSSYVTQSLNLEIK
jgi:hypothetical protein